MHVRILLIATIAGSSRVEPQPRLPTDVVTELEFTLDSDEDTQTEAWISNVQVLMINDSVNRLRESEINWKLCYVGTIALLVTLIFVAGGFRDVFHY